MYYVYQYNLNVNMCINLTMRKVPKPSLLLSSPNATPSPNALFPPGLVDVILRARRGPRVVPRKLAAAALARGNRTGCFTRRLASSLAGFWFLRATSTSLRSTAPPYPTSRSPAMARMGRKGFDPTYTPGLLDAFSGWFANLSFALGRGPHTPPGPAMVVIDRKDLT